MVIKNGNVGIGTTDPDAKLDIVSILTGSGAVFKEGKNILPSKSLIGIDFDSDTDKSSINSVESFNKITTLYSNSTNLP